VVCPFNREENAAGGFLAGVDTYAAYGDFISGNVFGFNNFSKFYNI
jgi:hypothetical protein